MRPFVTLALALILSGCALTHDPDGDAGATPDAGASVFDASAFDAGAPDAGSSDAGPFDCRVITFELADCLGLTALDCARCHHDPGADRWALCPEGAPPPFEPTPGPTLAECGIDP